MDSMLIFGFKNGGLEHYIEFWKLYKRPPKEEIWKYIISRLDLLVPQDVRERKGAFFTPQIWVEKSQEYIADVLGADWQDDYYIWDCCAGTGNLLNGLTNKYHIFASTLDQQDVDVMKERIKNGANLLESHVFQFDFLNDEFLPTDDNVSADCRDAARHVPTDQYGKLPPDLYKIISDPEKRKKLVIYINPPYAEAGTATNITGTGSNKTGVANTNKTYEKYKRIIGKAANEIYAQILIRIYCELQLCKIANFAKLKVLCASNFADFRNVYLSKLEKLFVVPAKTFDNVKGVFPIGFHIWDTEKNEKFNRIIADAYNADGSFFIHKTIQVDEKNLSNINKWIKKHNGDNIGFLVGDAPDYQHNKAICIRNLKNDSHYIFVGIGNSNLIEVCIYLSVRLCFSADWLNDRDQFLFPNDNWKTDPEFQTNCLIYTLFHGQNRISCKQGVNHWIPFSEEEVNSKALFDSHFMKDFLDGKIKQTTHNDGGLFADDAVVGTRRATSLQYSDESKSVLSAGRELWRYYHTKDAANPNASLYDIKEFFQGRNENGKMNASSDDPVYTKLLDDLKTALRALGEKIKPKVYEYGFLRG